MKFIKRIIFERELWNAFTVGFVVATVIFIIAALLVY